MIEQLLILGEVALAAFLGGLIGLEREAADKPAGFRTQMLVAAAAALLVGLAAPMIDYFKFEEGSDTHSDPIRIIEAIVTGVSFLGAGTIFRREQGDVVEGLTTAATILMSASIGICIAIHQYVIAIGVTLLALFILRGMLPLQKLLLGRRSVEKKG